MAHCRENYHTKRITHSTAEQQQQLQAAMQDDTHGYGDTLAGGAKNMILNWVRDARRALRGHPQRLEHTRAAHEHDTFALLRCVVVRVLRAVRG